VDDVFRALADPTRRLLLDRLRERDGQSLSELEGHLAGQMTRFGVMKHVRVLEETGLVTSRKVGREKFHYLNPVPIQLLVDRWVSRFAAPTVLAMSDLKHTLEEPMGAAVTDARPTHVFEIYIRSTPEQIWEALTDPAFTSQYYFGTAVSSTWEAGAPHAYTYPDGTVAAQGEVLEADAPRRLVMTFDATWDDEVRPDRPHRMTWEIQPMGDVCRLAVTHDEFDGDTATYRSVAGGMNLILSGLKTLLETGNPLGVG
jgi:uncharacterized protein YndB with AHSA1/START domain/DNA-binding transcriptional ArsR family regulator